jgi:RimJ/RimL family protein N-acetyltransferase
MIELHRIETEDLEWLRQQRNRQDLMLYFNQYREITEKEQEDWYYGLSDKFHPFIVWDNFSRLGYAALKDINNILRSAEFSIFITPFERNKGYGKTALKLLVDYGFNTLNLEVIHSIVFEFNKAIDVYKKFGFKVDGKLRNTCFKNGKYYDSYYISLLRDEYKNLNSNEPKIQT